ncbi:MAG: hypothetical protein JRJ84_25935 [Deltaproteobacteria bacterium]|nr:hypothetical protein [Deltaproteobacteria bacterium]
MSSFARRAVLAFGCKAAEDTGLDDTGVDVCPVPYGEGERTVRGRAYFFTMPTLGQIELVTDVMGAEVYVVEAPELRVTLQSSDAFAFAFDGLPDDCDVTLAAVHDDFFPHMTATWRVGGEDLEGLTFQSISNELVALTTGVYDVDSDDDTVCHMAATVTAIHQSQDTVWAVGEPGATVTIEPAVDEEQGPFYFNEMVLPDVTLSETTTDGGVIVIGADPGTYHWTGHKEGLAFRPLKMRCEGGWLTNASPPWGMQAEDLER